MKRTMCLFLILGLIMVGCTETKVPPTTPQQAKPGDPEPDYVPPHEINDPGPGGGGGQPGGGGGSGGYDYIWVDPSILLTRLRSGTAWCNLYEYAAQDFNWTDPADKLYPALWNNDGNSDVLALAKALVWMVMPDTPSDCSSTYDVGVYRSEIQQACLDIATSQPGRHIAPAGSGFCGDVWIAVARNLASFVIAIDYVGWTTQEQEEIWESYLASVVDVRLQDGMEGGQCPANGRTLREVGQQESNNIGCMARASLAAVFRHLYSNNQTHYQDLDNVRLWFRGWVGDRSSLVYTDFAENPSGSYTDTWHAGSGENRVPLLPAGTQFSHSGCTYDQLSGALPEELRRAELCDPMETGCDPMEDCDPGLPGTQCNVSAWPSVTCLNNGGHIKEDVHVYGALSGAFVTAELFRNYENNSLFNDVYTWEMNALRRAAEFVELERTTGPGPYRWDGFNGADNNGDDWWIPWIIKHLYPTVGAPIIHGTKPGKNMSFTDWTHHMGS